MPQILVQADIWRKGQELAWGSLEEGICSLHVHSPVMGGSGRTGARHGDG